MSITSPVLAPARASIRNRFQQDQHPEQPHRIATRMLDRGDVAKHETGISALSGDPDVRWLQVRTSQEILAP